MNQVFSFFVSPLSLLSLREIVPVSGCGGISPRRVARFLRDISGWLFSCAYACGCSHICAIPSTTNAGKIFWRCAHGVARKRATLTYLLSQRPTFSRGFQSHIPAVSRCPKLENGLFCSGQRFDFFFCYDCESHFFLLGLVFLIQGLSLFLFIIYYNPVMVSTIISTIFSEADFARPGRGGARRTLRSAPVQQTTAAAQNNRLTLWNQYLIGGCFVRVPRTVGVNLLGILNYRPGGR